MPSRTNEDTAERRRALQTWQERGAVAARDYHGRTGRTKRKEPKSARQVSISYADGWNAEMRLIEATRRIHSVDLVREFER